MECLQRPVSKNGHAVGKVLLDKCALEVYGQQNFVYTKQGFLMSDESVCLDVNEAKEDSDVLLISCMESERQKWKYSPSERSLRHIKSDLCLDVTEAHKVLTLKLCSDRLRSQKWDMISVDWK